MSGAVCWGGLDSVLSPAGQQRAVVAWWRNRLLCDLGLPGRPWGAAKERPLLSFPVEPAPVGEGTALPKQACVELTGVLPVSSEAHQGWRLAAGLRRADEGLLRQEADLLPRQLQVQEIVAASPCISNLGSGASLNGTLP